MSSSSRTGRFNWCRGEGRGGGRSFITQLQWEQDFTKTSSKTVTRSGHRPKLAVHSRPWLCDYSYNEADYNSGTVLDSTGPSKGPWSPITSRTVLIKWGRCITVPGQRSNAESQSSSPWAMGVLNLDDLLKASLGFRVAVTPCETAEQGHKGRWHPEDDARALRPRPRRPQMLRSIFRWSRPRTRGCGYTFGYRYRRQLQQMVMAPFFCILLRKKNN